MRTVLRGRGARVGHIVAGVVIVANCTTVAVANAQSAPPRRPAMVRLPDSAAPAAKHAATGSVASSAPAAVQLWLKPNTDAVTSFAKSVSDPNSAQYRHFLSPAQYTNRYAASPATAQKVARWLRTQGFARVAVDRQRNYVRASGNVGTAESAFDVQLKRYQVSSGGTSNSIIANDRDISLPANIADDVVTVTGLNNTPPHNELPKNVSAKSRQASDCSSYYGARYEKSLPLYYNARQFPTVLCGYTARQLRAAYGMNLTNTGVGQTVAYIEVGAPYKMAQTLRTWAAHNGLPAPKGGSFSRLILGRGNDCGNPFDIEEQLDIEAGYAMAPDQHQLLVAGDGCQTALEGAQSMFDGDLRVVDGDGHAPLASLVSNSWEVGSESAPAAYSIVVHSILLRAAAEGVGMYFSTGDNPGVEVPSDDPFATAVGGTTLAIGAANKRLFETGWSNRFLAVNDRRTGYLDGGIGQSAAGGGTSLLWRQPTYQQGVVPATMSAPRAGDVSGLRAVPDVSALADPYTGMMQGITVRAGGQDHYVTFPDGGTSLATPLLVGMVAAAQQGQARPFGFINPLLYRLAGSAAFHDPTRVNSATPSRFRAMYCPSSNDLCGEDSLQTLDFDGHAYTDQVTRTGYDTMTGIGSPNGQRFVAAVRAAAAGS